MPLPEDWDKMMPQQRVQWRRAKLEAEIPGLNNAHRHYKDALVKLSHVREENIQSYVRLLENKILDI